MVSPVSRLVLRVTTLTAGGIYLFTDRSSAEVYLTKHRQRLLRFGIRQVNAKMFAVNAELSQINRAPLLN
jgi:predicted site-specific integrase-resolvase